MLSTGATGPVKSLLGRDAGKLFLFPRVQIPDEHRDLQALAFTATITHTHTNTATETSAKRLAQLSARKQTMSDQQAMSREVHKQKPTELAQLTPSALLHSDITRLTLHKNSSFRGKH